MSILKQFYEAAKTNNVNVIKTLINSKEVKSHIDLVMVEAAALGHLEVVQFLVEDKSVNRKANIHFQDNRAFIWASNNSRWNIVEYLISKGIDKSFQNDYLHKQMVKNKVNSENHLYVTLTNKLKEEILNVSGNLKKLNDYEESAFLIGDETIMKFISDIKLEKLSSIDNIDIITNLLKIAIEHKNYEVLIACLSKIKITDKNFNMLLAIDNKEVIDFILNKIELTDKNPAFLSALECNLYMAMGILKKYSDFFKNDQTYLNYDNILDIEGYQYFFTKDSILPRYYAPLVYENTMQTFSAMLMNKVLTIPMWRKQKDTQNILYLLKEIIDQKQLLSIRDKDIVQILVENNYYLGGWYGDYKKGQNIFISVINTLIDNGISFSSDQKGYLIQLMLRNNMGQEKLLITKMANNGSNLNNLVERLNNKENWLNTEQEEELNDEDYNNDRTYTIYNKFDTLDFYDGERINVIDLYKDRKI